MKNERIVGVITGDLIQSTALSDEQKSHLKAELSRVLTGNPYVLMPLQFYRGDSFQLMSTCDKAPQLSILIESVIISTVNTLARISIGIGTASYIHENDVLQSEGEAFMLSGQQLDRMKAEDRIFKILTNLPNIQTNIDITTLLVENIIKDWKPGQASVISAIPNSETQRTIASKLNISPAAVSKTLKAAKWQAVEQYIQWFEETIKIYCHE